jgi:hypothetical protein
VHVRLTLSILIMITILNHKIDKIRLYRKFTPKKMDVYSAILKATSNYLTKVPQHLVGNTYITIFHEACDGKPFGTLAKDNDQSVSTKIIYTFSGTMDHGGVVGIEFCPFKLSEENWESFRTLLTITLPYGAASLVQTFKVSSYEYATDVLLPMEELKCLVIPFVKHVNTHFHEDGTLYLGHDYSPTSHKIYDKQKQLNEKKFVTVDKDVTRFETTVKGGGLRLTTLHMMKPPSSRVLLVQSSLLTKYLSNHPKEFVRNFVVDVLHGGSTAQELYLELPPKQRTVITKALKPLAINLNQYEPTELKWKNWITGKQNEILKNILFEH